jgi:hypothetical protein
MHLFPTRRLLICSAAKDKDRDGRPLTRTFPAKDRADLQRFGELR